MNDLAILEDFLAEPEAAAAEKGEGISDIIDAPGSTPNVNITKPDVIDAEIIKDKGGKPLINQAIDGKKKSEKILGAAVPSLDDFPVPTGGIALLVFIALLLVFAINPAPGKKETRLQLVWGAILGNYSVNGSGGSGATQTAAPAGKSAMVIPLNYIQGGMV